MLSRTSKKKANGKSVSSSMIRLISRISDIHMFTWSGLEVNSILSTMSLPRVDRHSVLRAERISSKPNLFSKFLGYIINLF